MRNTFLRALAWCCIAALPLAATEGRWLEPGKIAYLRIPSFFHPQFEKPALERAREFAARLYSLSTCAGMPAAVPPGRRPS